MKKQINPTIKAYLIRSAFYLLLLLGVCAIPFTLAQRNLFKQTISSADIEQTKSKVAIEDPWHGYALVRTMPANFVPGPYRVPGYQYSSLVRPLVPSVNALINNNTGATGTSEFTQSETSVVSFGSTIVAGFNDSGSFASGNHFTGWSFSTDRGATWTDGGFLPVSPGGDAGDPVLARDNTSAVLYFATLGFVHGDIIQVFRSTDNGVTWLAPVTGTPGASQEDKEWIALNNFA